MKKIFMVILLCSLTFLTSCGNKDYEGIYYEDTNFEITNQEILDYSIASGDCYSYLVDEIINFIYKDFQYDINDEKLSELIDMQVYGNYYSYLDYLTETQKAALTNSVLDTLSIIGIDAETIYDESVREYFSFLLDSTTHDYSIEIYDKYIATYYQYNIQSKLPYVTDLECYKGGNNIDIAKVTYKGQEHIITKDEFLKNNVCEYNKNTILIQKYANDVCPVNYKSEAQKYVLEAINQSASYIKQYGEDEYILLGYHAYNRQELIKSYVNYLQMRYVIEQSYAKDLDEIYDNVLEVQKEYYSMNFINILFYLQEDINGRPVTTFFEDIKINEDKDAIYNAANSLLEHLRHNYYQKDDLLTLEKTYNESSLAVFSNCRDLGLKIKVEVESTVTNSSAGKYVENFKNAINTIASLKHEKFYIYDSSVTTEYGLHYIVVTEGNYGSAKIDSGNFANVNDVISKDQLNKYIECKIKGESTPTTLEAIISEAYNQYFNNTPFRHYKLGLSVEGVSDFYLAICGRRSIGYDNNSIYKGWVS